jgi:gliding motility-associated-like protein
LYDNLRLFFMSRLLLAFCLFFSFSVFGQTPADWWYFGDSAGVHFTPTGPVAVTDGKLVTTEGCASISSNTGDLLFYTDGTSVYNAQHQIMPNGTGLLGNSSSTQSAIIVPYPGTLDKYFIITVPVPSFGGGGFGMSYSVVDMALEAGLGDVDTLQKNIPIASNVGENVCAVRHANGQSFWIVSHKLSSDTVVAFEFDASGFNPTPSVSLTGDVIDAWVGSIKASPSGNYIGFASQNNVTNGRITLMSFDNQTGLVDTALFWSSAEVVGPYGIEFSGDSKILYVSDGWAGQNRSIVQYDIDNFDLATITASEYLIADSIAFGQLQMGPDQKIYLTSATTFFGTGSVDSFLHRINDPEVLGIGCNFEQDAVFLNGRTANLGLPPFISSYFNTSLTAADFCFTDSTAFDTDTAGVDSVFWNFGDPASLANNFSNEFVTTHVFTDTGAFTVQLIAWSDTLVDTVFQTVQIYPRQQIDFGPDTSLCLGDTLPLFIRQPYSSFLWNDSSQIDSALIISDTMVWATVIGVCDTVSDTISVLFDQPLDFDFGADTSLCVGDSFLLDAAFPSGTGFNWNTTDTLDSILVRITGDYILVASNQCGVYTDSINVVFNPVPGVNVLSEDTINCFNDPVFLSRPINDSLSFIWSDSSTDETFRVDTSALVWLAVSNECGFSVDTMNVVFNGEIKTELGEDITICPGDSIALNGADPTAIYLWNTGETSDTIFTDQADKLYTVTITLNDCQKIESKRVDLSDFACENIDCKVTYSNVFSPNGDGYNDIWRTRTDCVDYTYDLRIYNRWGQLVHTSDRRNYGWDGYINGEPAATGVYFFVMEFTDGVVVNVDNQAFRGSITLVR